ncbi:MAG: ribonuclease R [Bacteroides sp.]|nr:ribonuclease R [Bacteroidales bacterium]MBD5325956.1 ribonuclease R [Bacteroides sp.]MBD5327863.1 ribonuclease R [Bacteroides sp.]MBD5415978.1 ribonuclease R [Bacteroides sp.]MDE6222180.1 ribonuclease R [Muribaculaceae bacterium]
MKTTSKPKKGEAKLFEQIAQYIQQQKNNTFNYKQVSAAIGAKTGPKQRIVAMRLYELSLDGEIVEVAPGKYKAPNRSNIMTGTFVRRSNGKNSVVTDEDGESIFVAERNSMHALNGDKVRVMVSAARRGAEPEAEVVEILEKNDQVFIGVLTVERGYALLNTDSKFLATDIFIPKEKLRGGKTGDKVVARITAWPEHANMPKGEVVDVLGKNGDNNTEIHAILAEFGLPYKYPEAVERAAKRIGPGITPEEIAKREDCREVLTFTIDPKDAKDFDDALSIRKLANGHYEVGVHIADVTHYVHPDTSLDKEAQKRATSIYLVDRVVPMLPEHLSNGVCSLRPNEEKLTFSCIFEMDENGTVFNHRIGKTVICSNRRFAYEEAQEIIETGKGEYAEEILILDKIAKALRAERFKKGAMEFDRAEVKFNLDENGKPVGVYYKVSKDANKLVEELMLLANRTVATAIGKPAGNKKPKAFVYRIHDKPDEQKLNDLASMASAFGYRIKTTGSPREINRSINQMLKEVKGRGEENLLSVLALRSMAKAVYSVDNIGHYGLCFDYYTHFTSPIRRFPDMMVHRLLAKYLDGGRSANQDKLEEQCEHSSKMEQTAINAERSSIKYKQVEFMQERIGEEYAGVISGVTEWGLYVELTENLCEGLIPIRDLGDDYYELDERNFRLIGRRTGRSFRLGDEVVVRVARADLQRRQLDFVLVEDKGNGLQFEQPKPRKRDHKKTGSRRK